MCAPEIDPLLASEVARQKKIAAENRAENRAREWILPASLIAGVVVGVGIWFIQEPMDREWSSTVCVGMIIFVLGVALHGVLFATPNAGKCPQCGYAWDIQEDGRDWLTWKCCPGCGLKMSDDTSSQEKP